MVLLSIVNCVLCIFGEKFLFTTLMTIIDIIFDHDSTDLRERLVLYSKKSKLKADVLLHCESFLTFFLFQGLASWLECLQLLTTLAKSKYPRGLACLHSSYRARQR